MDELQSINQQMALISNLARAYYNATPEQRANVSIEDMQEQINRYNELKSRRKELYAEQEARVQNELLAMRQAEETRQAINSRGSLKRTPKGTPKITEESIPTEVITQTEPVNVVLTEEGSVIPVSGGVSNNSNYYTGPITGMRIRKPFTIGGQIVGNYNVSNGIIPSGIIRRHGGPTGESILGGENIVPVDMGTGTVNTGSVESFPIFFRDGSGQYYEYGDQGTIKGMTGMNNTGYVNPYFTGYNY